jgi:hypothetical protein
MTVGIDSMSQAIAFLVTEGWRLEPGVLLAGTLSRPTALVSGAVAIFESMADNLRVKCLVDTVHVGLASRKV